MNLSSPIPVAPQIDNQGWIVVPFGVEFEERCYGIEGVPYGGCGMLY